MSVVIKKEGESKYGVVGGVATDAMVKERVETLKKSLEKDKFKVIGEFLLARCNPPWTLHGFRTNEDMIPIE
ncbi:hypothetical protein HHK36_019549 [Tetracentron sinense]|uniref:Uncharacterized protein n=1 Tax=Tetracentron sinense TaxID=13715 RepID=A0A835DCV3_TETSI|nr:hypothetical protein HHK36_019549 [Tetracentron sinense]